MRYAAVLLASLLSSISGVSQTLTNAVADAPTITLTTGKPFAAGDPVVLYSGSSGAGCDGTFGIIVSEPRSVLATAGPTAIKLQVTLSAGSVVCGFVKHNGANTKIPAVPVVAPPPADPSIVLPLALTDQAVNVVKGGKAVAGDAVFLYAAPASGDCNSYAGDKISVAGSTLAAGNSTAVKLLNGSLSSGSYVCGAVKHAGSFLTIAPVAVTAGASPVLFPAPAAGDEAVQVITAGGAAPADVLAIHTAPTAADCSAAAATGRETPASVPGTVLAAGSLTRVALTGKLQAGYFVCGLVAHAQQILPIAPVQVVAAVLPTTPGSSGRQAAAGIPSAAAAAVTKAIDLRLQSSSLVDVRGITQGASSIGLYTVPGTGKCNTKDGTLMPLAVPASDTLAGGATSATLSLAKPLPTGAMLCAIDSKGTASPIYVYIPSRQPVFAKTPSEGSALVAVQATPSDPSTIPVWTTDVQLLTLSSATDPCDISHGVEILQSSGAPLGSQKTDKNGAAAFSLIPPLAAGSYLCALQTTSVNTAGVTRLPLPDPQISDASATPQAVASQTDWGLVRAYFTGGTVIANDNSNFSTANLFFALNVDKTWIMPRFEPKPTTTGTGTRTGGVKSTDKSDSSISHYFVPGLNTFFESRLTAIPVASNPANTSSASTTETTGGTTGTTGGTSGTAGTTGTTGTTAASNSQSFITTQKTARVGVGIYFPVLLTNWTWNKSQNALFVAPMAKIGFDTITGAQSQNVVLPGGAVGTQTYAQLYNYRNFGARIGHMQLSGSKDKAPEVFSYLDVTFGPYSNLESLICNRTRYTADIPATNNAAAVAGSPIAGQQASTNFPDSLCKTTYPSFYVAPGGGSTDVYDVYETRKRIYRLDLEGLLKVPGTPIYVGFNANLGQRALMAHHFDPQFKAPDDLRFFFGTKFDLSTLLTKLGVNPVN